MQSVGSAPGRAPWGGRALNLRWGRRRSRGEDGARVGCPSRRVGRYGARLRRRAAQPNWGKGHPRSRSGPTRPPTRRRADPAPRTRQPGPRPRPAEPEDTHLRGWGRRPGQASRRLPWRPVHGKRFVLDSRPGRLSSGRGERGRGSRAPPLRPRGRGLPRPLPRSASRGGDKTKPSHAWEVWEVGSGPYLKAHPA